MHGTPKLGLYNPRGRTCHFPIAIVACAFTDRRRVYFTRPFPPPWLPDHDPEPLLLCLQVGLAEMKVVVERTGGVAVLAEAYAHPVFKQSFARLVSREGEGALGVAARGTFEVFPSRDVKINGAIGPCAPLDKKNASVADTEVGWGGTSAWRCVILNTRAHCS